MSNFKEIHIIAGGTVFHIAPHLALSAPAYGNTGWDLVESVYCAIGSESKIYLHLTKMAEGRAGDSTIYFKNTVRTPSSKYGSSKYGNAYRSLETNEDIEKLINQLVEDEAAKIIFMPVALCDFTANVIDGLAKNVIAGASSVRSSGKNQPRLKSDQRYMLELTPSDKIINKVRAKRKDIFLVGFKTTTGFSVDEQFESGLTLLKKASCNLVLANDLQTRMNMVITPEQSKYAVTTNRSEALFKLTEMALERSKGDFTRSTVVSGDPVEWNSSEVPSSLREVVNYCIKKGAYKPFLNSTVGHFAVKTSEGEFLTSIRKTNFNNLDSTGLVRVKADEDDKNVIAFGAKPSVGGQSQRIIFRNHPDVDCIVHAHVQLRPESVGLIPVKDQWPNECGSNQCGTTTSTGLIKFGEGTNSIYAVMLDKHGPNIVFNRAIDPKKVIGFIEQHFDLSKQTSEIN